MDASNLGKENTMQCLLCESVFYFSLIFLFYFIISLLLFDVQFVCVLLNFFASQEISYVSL